MSYSDNEILHAKVGDTEINTTLAPEGDRWISTVKGGPMDGYASVMDKSGDINALHAQVIADVTTAQETPAEPAA